jgi:hypothetical protein
MTGFEILSCPKCGWQGTPRPAVRKWVLPCSRCGSIDLEVSDLEKVNTRPVRSRSRTTVGVERTFEPAGGGVDDLVDRDQRADRHRPGARPAPAPATPELDPSVYLDPWLEP